jgi:hypothetical protein
LRKNSQHNSPDQRFGTRKAVADRRECGCHVGRDLRLTAGYVLGKGDSFQDMEAIECMSSACIKIRTLLDPMLVQRSRG